VDGNDIIATYEVAKEYIDRARSGGGPGLIVAQTYRLRPHYEGDAQIYRPKGEAEEWWKKDPLPRYQKKLIEMGILTEADVSKLEKEIRAEVEKAAKAALALSPPKYENHIKGAIDEL
jgi:pyruvate dehydrogenase E1 component alpha subunit